MTEEQPAVLPIQGDLYDFAVKQCPPATNTCSPIGQSVYDELFHNSESDSTLSKCQSNFINTLKGSGFDTINTEYKNYLGKGEYTTPDIAGNYVAQYLSAILPIEQSAMVFYQALGLMYNMQAIQLAFHYANPTKFDETGAFISYVGGIKILSSKTGRDGYEESMHLLSQAYAKTFLSDSSTSIPNAFGGKKYTYSDSNNTLTPSETIAKPSLKDVTSLNTFVNGKINGKGQKLFNITKNKLFDPAGKGLTLLGANQDAGSFLNNCQITSANLPVPLGSTTSFTNLKFICYVIQGNVNYTTGTINIGLPYSYDTDYTYPVENLDLVEVNPNEGSLYIAPSDSSISSLSDYKPDDNKKTKDITTLPSVVDEYCKKGAYPSYSTNSGYSYNESKSETIFILPELRIEFDGHFIQYSGDSSDYPRGCNQDGCATTTTQMGADGYIDYSYSRTGGAFINAIPGGTATSYVVTHSGHLYTVTQSFPSSSKLCSKSLTGDSTTCPWGNNIASPQSIYLQCIEGDTSCSANNGSLIFDNYVDLVYTAVDPLNKHGDHNFSLADYSAYKFYTKNYAYYLFDIRDFNNWKNTTHTGTPSETYSFNISFLEGNTTNQIDSDIEILKSENGNYRLAFVAAKSNQGSFKIQQKSGDGWSEYKNAFNYRTSDQDSSDSLAGVSFQAGNLTLFYYNPSSGNGIDLTSTNSIAGQYKDHGYVWVADPYAKLELQNDGTLVIHSSNESSTGKLGFVDTNGHQIIWDSNFINSSNVWDNVKNPKLLSSDDSEAQVQES